MASKKRNVKPNWKVPDSVYFELFGAPSRGRPGGTFKLKEEPMTAAIRRNAERRALRVLKHIYEEEFLEYLQEEISYLNYEQRKANYEKGKKNRT